MPTDLVGQEMDKTQEDCLSLLYEDHVSAGKILEASGGSFTPVTDTWVWLGLSTRELTHGLSLWLGLPRKMVASG